MKAEASKLERRRRPPRRLDLEAVDAPVAEIGGVGQAARVDQIGLDVGPARIGDGGVEAEPVGVRPAEAHARLVGGEAVGFEALRGRRRAGRGDGEAAGAEALLEAARRAAAARPSRQVIAAVGETRTSVRSGSFASSGRVERHAGAARIGEPAADRADQPVGQRQAVLAEQGRLGDLVAHAGDRQGARRAGRGGGGCG